MCPTCVNEAKRAKYASDPEERRKKIAASTEWFETRGFTSCQAMLAEEAARRGGACQHPRCTWTEDLEWHHRDPTIKKTTVTARMSLARLAEELIKCDLLCPNHHRKADRLLRVASAAAAA